MLVKGGFASAQMGESGPLVRANGIDAARMSDAPHGPASPSSRAKSREPGSFHFLCHSRAKRRIPRAQDDPSMQGAPEPIETQLRTTAKLALANPQHHEPGFAKTPSVSAVSTHIATDFRGPVLCVRLGNSATTGTSVPKAAINEHCHSKSVKQQIRRSKRDRGMKGPPANGA